ncbi:MAG: COX15/CtaA family protein [Acidimicrobiia bacterium]|nr:COX15/CtaA family protein [Acidimicrobiia bacterium]
MPSTRRLAQWSLATTVFLVMLGGYTRGSGSGYGCQDRWPLCEDGLLGGLLPRLEYHMIVEWTHRWVAAVVGILIVATALAAWRQRPRNRHAAWPATAAIVVVGIQAWLGRAIVKGDLARDLVSIHLTVSMAIVGLLVLVVMATSSHSPQPRGLLWRGALIIGAATAYGVLLLGSLVHNLYFAGWPILEAGLVPEFSNRYVVLHFVHRLVAGAGFAYLVYLAVRAWRTGRAEKTLLAVAAGAFTVNVALGAVHVFTEVTSAAVVALHLLFAAIAWAAAVGAAALAWGWSGAASVPVRTGDT